jgi:hypothetical protein
VRRKGVGDHVERAHPPGNEARGGRIDEVVDDRHDVEVGRAQAVQRETRRVEAAGQRERLGRVGRGNAGQPVRAAGGPVVMQRPAQTGQAQEPGVGQDAVRVDHGDAAVANPCVEAQGCPARPGAAAPGRPGRGRAGPEVEAAVRVTNHVEPGPVQPHAAQPEAPGPAGQQAAEVVGHHDAVCIQHGVGAAAHLQTGHGRAIRIEVEPVESEAVARREVEHRGDRGARQGGSQNDGHDREHGEQHEGDPPAAAAPARRESAGRGPIGSRPLSLSGFRGRGRFAPNHATACRRATPSAAEAEPTRRGPTPKPPSPGC